MLEIFDFDMVEKQHRAQDFGEARLKSRVI